MFYITFKNILCNATKRDRKVKIAIMIIFSKNMEKWFWGMEFKLMGNMGIIYSILCN